MTGRQGVAKTNNTLPLRIFNSRKAKGWKQPDLARKLYELTKKDTEPIQVTKATISEWERGKTKVPHEAIVALAKLFGTTTDWLLCAPWAKEEEWRNEAGEVIYIRPETDEIARQLDAMHNGVRRMVLSKIPQLIAECIADWNENQARLAEVREKMVAAMGEEKVRAWEIEQGISLPKRNSS